jgi:hypothetical protein
MYVRGLGDNAGTPLMVAGAAAGLVPPRAGVSPAVAQQACVNANGVWDAINVGCALPSVPDLPGGYCSWFPFASSLFSGCSGQIVTDLQNVGAYTAYQAGMIQNDPSVTAQLMAQNLADSQNLVDNTDTTPSYGWLYALLAAGGVILLTR